MRDNTIGMSHKTEDVEHINALILRFDGSNQFVLNRFEPQYKTDETGFESMTNITENSIWTQIILTVIQKCYQDQFPSKNLQVSYQSVVQTYCPSLGKFGLQFIEMWTPRGETEHIGYCQTWSLTFLEYYLRQLCFDPPYPTPEEVLNLITAEVLQGNTTIPLGTDGKIPLWVQNNLYTWIKNRASQYCKILFDEVYTPYFVFKETGQMAQEWQRNLINFP
jgi:hypothetical protein